MPTMHGHSICAYPNVYICLRQVCIYGPVLSTGTKLLYSSSSLWNKNFTFLKLELEIERYPQDWN